MARPARCGYCGAAIEQPKRGLRRWCDQRCRYRGSRDAWLAQQARYRASLTPDEDARQRRLRADAQRRRRQEGRSWEQRHPEQARAIAARERERNAERYRRREAAYREEHREEARKRARVWARSNPARRRMRRRVDQAARRARMRGQFVERVEPLVVLERDAGLCGICGAAVDPEDFHVDHVRPLAAGGEHSYANVQAAHPDCNLRKGARV